MCKGSQTTTSTNSPSPEALGVINGVVQGAQTTASNNPYVPYTGEIAAGQNAQQAGAEGNIANAAQYTTDAANIAQPYYNEGLGALQNGATDLQNYGLPALGNASNTVGAGVGTLGQATGAYGVDAGLTAAGAGAVNAQQFSPNAVGQYLSPYTNDVVNATQNQFNLQNQQNLTSALSKGIQSGNAFGGDREGIAESQLAGQEQTAQAPVIAGLENQGYTQALNEFNTQQGVNLSAQQANKARLLQAGAQMGQVGSGLQGVGSTYGSLAGTETGVGTASGTLGTELGNIGTSVAGLGQSRQTGQIAAATAIGNANTASLAAGTQAQQTQQAQDTAAYQQYQLGQAFPYAQESWLAGIDTGAVGSLGGTNTTTSPAPSALNSIIGGASTLGAAYLLSSARGGRINAPKGLGKEENRIGLAAGGNPMFGGVPWLTPAAVNWGNGLNIKSVAAPQQAAAANFGPASGLLTKGLHNNSTNPGGTPGYAVSGDSGPSSYGGPGGPSPLVDPSIVSADASLSGLYAAGGGVLGL